MRCIAGICWACLGFGGMGLSGWRHRRCRRRWRCGYGHRVALQCGGTMCRVRRCRGATFRCLRCLFGRRGLLQTHCNRLHIGLFCYRLQVLFNVFLSKHLWISLWLRMCLCRSCRHRSTTYLWPIVSALFFIDRALVWRFKRACRCRMWNRCRRFTRACFCRMWRRCR